MKIKLKIQKWDSLTGGYGTLAKACGPFMIHVFYKHVQYLKKTGCDLVPNTAVELMYDLCGDV